MKATGDSEADKGRWSPLAWTWGYSVIRVQGPKSPGRTVWSWLEAPRVVSAGPVLETTWAERGRETSWLPSFFHPSTSTALLSKLSKKPAGKRPGGAAYRWRSKWYRAELAGEPWEKQPSVSTRASSGIRLLPAPSVWTVLCTCNLQIEVEKPFKLAQHVRNLSKLKTGILQGK